MNAACRFLPALGLGFVLCLTACRRTGPPDWRDAAGYHVRQGKVWYFPSWTSRAFVVEGADPTTLVFPLSDLGGSPYAKDHRHVYWSGRPVPGLDPATLEFLEGGFTRDAQKVFYNDHLVCEDAAHFERLGPLFVKNSQAVYFLSPLNRPPAQRVVSTDPVHFRRAGPGESHTFYADLQQFLAAGKVMEGVDPSQVRFLGGDYWAAGGRIYYWNELMDDATELNTIAVLEGGYARDARRVYHLGKVVAEADPATFEVTNPTFQHARDARHVFEQGKLIPGK